MCANTNGSFTCSCVRGYFGDAYVLDGCKGIILYKFPVSINKKKKNTDADECGDNTYSCSNNSFCSNTVGSYNCTCNSGYQGNASIVGGCQGTL